MVIIALFSLWNIFSALLLSNFLIEIYLLLLFFFALKVKVKLKPSVVILFSYSLSLSHPSTPRKYLSRICVCVRHKVEFRSLFASIYSPPPKKSNNTPSLILLDSNTITMLLIHSQYPPLSLSDVFTNNKIIISAIKLINPSDVFACAKEDTSE